jgi:hypothetical protein
MSYKLASLSICCAAHVVQKVDTGPNAGFEQCAPQAPLTTISIVGTMGGTDLLSAVCCKNSVTPQNFDTCYNSDFAVGSLNSAGGLWGTADVALVWTVPPSPPPPPPRPPSPPPPRYAVVWHMAWRNNGGTYVMLKPVCCLLDCCVCLHAKRHAAGVSGAVRHILGRRQVGPHSTCNC